MQRAVIKRGRGPARALAKLCSQLAAASKTLSATPNVCYSTQKLHHFALGAEASGIDMFEDGKAVEPCLSATISRRDSTQASERLAGPRRARERVYRFEVKVFDQISRQE